VTAPTLFKSTLTTTRDSISPLYAHAREARRFSPNRSGNFSCCESSRRRRSKQDVYWQTYQLSCEDLQLFMLSVCKTIFDTAINFWPSPSPVMRFQAKPYVVEGGSMSGARDVRSATPDSSSRDFRSAALSIKAAATLASVVDLASMRSVVA
jgi:hypothetical protein